MCDYHDKSKQVRMVKSRRALLQKGLGILGFASATQLDTLFVKGAALTTDTPEETEGPFWIDEQLNRSNVRSNTANAASNPGVTVDGLPLHLAISLSKLVNNVSTPLEGCYIDIWQANAQGSYSDESNTTTINESYTVGENFLRGYQVTDAHGIVEFLCNYPAYYNGRCPHIHVRVRNALSSSASTNFTTQLFFDDDVTTVVYESVAAYATNTQRTYNADDMVYNTVTASVGSTAADPDGARLLVRLADDGTYAMASFNIVIV